MSDLTKHCISPLRVQISVSRLSGGILITAWLESERTVSEFRIALADTEAEALGIASKFWSELTRTNEHCD